MGISIDQIEIVAPAVIRIDSLFFAEPVNNPNAPIVNINQTFTLAVAISNIGEASSREFLGISIQYYLIIGAVIIVGLLILIFLLLYKTETIIKIIAKISPKIADYLRRFISNFKSGFNQLKKNKINLIYVILLGFPVWFIDGFIVVIFFYVLGYTEINIMILVLAKL